MIANLSITEAPTLTLEQLAEAQNAVFALVHRQLKVDTVASPREVEEVIDLLDSGLLDEEVARVVPMTQPPAIKKPRMFADLTVFDDEQWKARHRVQD